MYRISNDLRITKSADKIVESLFRCSKKHNLDDITFSMLSKDSGVSRATIYRIFDNVNDILLYKGSLLYDEIKKHKKIENFKEHVLYVIDFWIANSNYLEVIFKNYKYNIFIELHYQNLDYFEQLFDTKFDKNNIKTQYMISTITSLIPTFLHSWYSHNKKETPEELYEYMCYSLTSLSKLIKNR